MKTQEKYLNINQLKNLIASEIFIVNMEKSSDLVQSENKIFKRFMNGIHLPSIYMFENNNAPFTVEEVGDNLILEMLEAEELIENESNNIKNWAYIRSFRVYPIRLIIGYSKDFTKEDFTQIIKM